MEGRETADERDVREAEILAGEIPVELSDGRTVVVREIRWGESLYLGAKLRTIIEEVAKKDATQSLDPIGIWEIPEDYPEEFIWTLSTVCDLSEEELRALKEEDGHLLEAAFWRMNTTFFARRVGRLLRLAQGEARSRTPESSTPPHPGSSSPPSSATGTEPAT